MLENIDFVARNLFLGISSTFFDQYLKNGNKISDENCIPNINAIHSQTSRKLFTVRDCLPLILIPLLLLLLQ